MKILFPTPVIYDGNDARYLARDGARFSDFLCRNGHQGVKVILAPENGYVKPTSTLLSVGSMQQWLDPSYWRDFRADGALCYFGLSCARFLPVIRAMKDAGLRLALKMDSPLGVVPSWLANFNGTFPQYWFFRERFPPPLAFMRTLVSILRALVFGNDPKIKPFLSAFDIVTAESPLAVRNTQVWCQRNGCHELANHVYFLPHPVPDSFQIESNVHCKDNVVLATALDWSNPRKGGILIADALRLFLARHPTWSAVVIGANSSDVAHRAGARVLSLNAMKPEQILPFYQKAKIFFTASGSESGPIVAFEAVACHCSLVFPPHLRHLCWATESGMGTMSAKRTASSLAAALEAETILWDAKPNRTPETPLPPLRVTDVSRQLLALLFPLAIPSLSNSGDKNTPV